MKTETVFGAVAGAAIGSMGLFLASVFVGGNVATDFEFAELRGYEATGVLGFIVGLVGGGALGAYLARGRTARHE